VKTIDLGWDDGRFDADNWFILDWDVTLRPFDIVYDRLCRSGSRMITPISFDFVLLRSGWHRSLCSLKVFV